MAWAYVSLPFERGFFESYATMKPATGLAWLDALAVGGSVVACVAAWVATGLTWGGWRRGVVIVGVGIALPGVVLALAHLIDLAVGDLAVDLIEGADWRTTPVYALAWSEESHGKELGAIEAVTTVLLGVPPDYRVPAFVGSLGGLVSWIVVALRSPSGTDR